MRFLLQTGSGEYALSVLLTWAIIVGALYGCLRLVRDVVHFFRRYEKKPAAPPPASTWGEPPHH